VSLQVAVLEDDAELRENILVPMLSRFDFEVQGFATSIDLFQAMLVRAFDLLVLDIGLPDADGFTVARRLRENFAIGIVILTGRRATADQVKGLTEAADAWLVKPVEVEVIAATLHSLARRMRLNSSEKVATAVAAQWRLAPEGWRLHAPGDGSMALNQSERRLLTRLFAVPGELVTHDELISTLITAAEDVDLHRLEMLIHRLRRKVSTKFGKHLPLRSVRGRGYVIFVDDERAADSDFAS
jgi:DNA-binding response OmpR family regulator